MIAALFATMGLLLDSSIIQMGTGYSTVHEETIKYYVIWKSSELRIVSSYTLTDKGKAVSTTVIENSDTLARDAFITSFEYTGLYERICNAKDIGCITISKASCTSFSKIIRLLQLA
eukprot:341829_1